MESNRSVKGFALAKTYQLLFFALALHVCAVESAYVKFANNPEQRKLCRVNTNKSTCDQDGKCGWNDWQGLCNEAGHQPLVQSCQEKACGGQTCLFERPVCFVVPCIYLYFYMLIASTLTTLQEEVTQYLRAGDHLNAPLAAKNCTLAPWRLVMASKEAAA